MQYQLPSLTASALSKKITKQWRLTEGTPQTIRGEYFDTFDWRLYLSGFALFVEQVEKGFQLQLIDREKGVVISTAGSKDLPGMIESIPQGTLCERLEDVIEMRKLLPLVSISGNRIPATILNDDDKTVVRLEMIETAAGEAKVVLPLSLTVTPLRGYESDSSKLIDWLEARKLIGSDKVLHLDAALKVIGREGGDYSSKLNFKLDPMDRADIAAKHIQLHLLNTLEKNIDGSYEDIDSEYLHDLRVAVRRTRSALSQIKAVFEDEVVERFKEDFAWIGSVTGPTRDMHVYLLKFHGYLESLPENYHDALDPFHRYLERHQESEHKVLAKHLRSKRFTQTLSDWREFLQAEAPENPKAANAGKSVKEVADSRIHKMFKRVMKEGGAINDGSPAEMLHDMRKSCKKLRYLMEFFQSLYPSADIKKLIKAIKVLLDNLGDFQDLEVQAEKLELISDEMRRTRVKTHTLLAMGMLIEDLLHRQHQERLRFAEEFKAFSSKDNQALFTTMFGTREGKT